MVVCELFTATFFTTASLLLTVTLLAHMHPCWCASSLHYEPDNTVEIYECISTTLLLLTATLLYILLLYVLRLYMLLLYILLLHITTVYNTTYIATVYITTVELSICPVGEDGTRGGGGGGGNGEMQQRPSQVANELKRQLAGRESM